MARNEMGVALSKKGIIRSGNFDKMPTKSVVGNESDAAGFPLRPRRVDAQNHSHEFISYGLDLFMCETLDL
jgi:hypothetical protein